MLFFNPIFYTLFLFIFFTLFFYNFIFFQLYFQTKKKVERLKRIITAANMAGAKSMSSRAYSSSGDCRSLQHLVGRASTPLPAHATQRSPRLYTRQVVEDGRVGSVSRRWRTTPSSTVRALVVVVAVATDSH